MNEPSDDLDVLLSEYSDVSAALAELVAHEPPAGLRDLVLAGARTRRVPGRPLDAVEPATPDECFAKTSAELGGLLASLSEEQWAAPAHPVHGTVYELVRHLVGVERLGVAWLTPGGSPPIPVDHVATARVAAADLDGAQPAVLLRELAEAAGAVADVATTGERSRQVLAYGLHTDVDGYLVARTFEIWAHGIDIARAVGLPQSQLDPERMAAMSRLLVQAIPAALARRGVTAEGRSARFVLTGPAGGAYTVPLAPSAAADEPSFVLVADPVRLCRRAANRVTADGVGAALEGDVRLARQVIEALDAFAAD